MPRGTLDVQNVPTAGLFNVKICQNMVPIFSCSRSSYRHHLFFPVVCKEEIILASCACHKPGSIFWKVIPCVGHCTIRIKRLSNVAWWNNIYSGVHVQETYLELDASMPVVQTLLIPICTRLVVCLNVVTAISSHEQGSR